MSFDHAMICPAGGYPICRHNEIRDLVAEALRPVASEVIIEPTLLPHHRENLWNASANTSPEARVDVMACGF